MFKRHWVRGEAVILPAKCCGAQTGQRDHSRIRGVAVSAQTDSLSRAIDLQACSETIEFGQCNDCL
jgi:hypothetical protein